MWAKFKQKRFLYPSALVLQISAVLLIGHLFGLETANSLLGLIWAYIFFGTIVYFLIKIIKEHKAMLAVVELPFPINMSTLKLMRQVVIFAILFMVGFAPFAIFELMSN